MVEWNEMHPVLDADNKKPCMPCMKFVYSSSDVFYDPYRERHQPMWRCQELITNRDIDKGEEILDNYMDFIGIDESVWITTFDELQYVCNGGIGYITQYESEED
jgi:hypothetical protein